jgi:hypothetical protein
LVELDPAVALLVLPFLLVLSFFIFARLPLALSCHFFLIVEMRRLTPGYCGCSLELDHAHGSAVGFAVSY